MASCNYRILNDIYTAINAQLDDISDKIENLQLNIDVGELDIDLDNLETQLELSNKLKFLELVGIDIMSEEDQLQAYQEIMAQLFGPIGHVDGMVEEEEEEP